ncbi:short chain dehydrogenase [Aspergillus sclerotialis]|uniref:Short chain dehydrogenase n=1 Tax=Aspergillus sclerotialis TaxID=2070753 RepID=A0A3A2ZRI0_9EURO|nr:short chain dehydrogenase [Aspergillus sclerotialis]
MVYELKGTAFITGGGSGIGKSTAFAFAQNGIQGLVLVDINATVLEGTRDELKTRYPKLEVLIIATDVANEASVDSAVNAAVEKFGRVDIAINSAGISGVVKKSADMDLKDWQKVIDVNQTGVWLCQRAMIRQMLKQESSGPREGRGVIVNVSSMYGVTCPPPEFAIGPYVASKHAVVAFTKFDAKTYGPHGIRINAICPGYVDTPILGNALKAGHMQPELEKTPLRRAAQVEEIADSILFLVSPRSSFMCGAALVVDGGYSL